MGFVRITATRVEMKTGKGGEVERVLAPRASIGAAVAALDRWIKAAGIGPANNRILNHGPS